VTDQKPGVTLGYSKVKGQYHVEEIRSNKPTVTYATGRMLRVDDWLNPTDANSLGLVADLIVRPYRLDA
jgi:hypothetical protein